MSLPAPLLVQSLKDAKEAIRVGRSLLDNLQTQQWERFQSNAPIAHLISERTNFIDQLLRRVWKHHIGQTDHLCLVAVGGYGRGELHPFSDIDILILTAPSGVNKQEQNSIESFITYLWDIGLQVGHAIRTLNECFDMGKEDISTATNYTEARWLIGHYEAFDGLRDLWKNPDFWDSQSFFLAKVHEQEVRHSKAHDALAQLEPNIKESPGGMRDIHTIAWVAKRHFGANSLQQLVTVGFLSVEEYSELERAMRFHWRVRFVLHSIKKRKEERLLFDHQKVIAQTLGYQDSTGKLAVEAFMQDYYRNAKTIQRLNTLLLQHFREALLSPEAPHIIAIDDAFSIINNALSVRDEQVFIQQPIQLLRVFLLLESSKVHTIRASTQRHIQSYAHLVNEAFCQQPETWQCFRNILRQPQGVTRTLRTMHAHGILGRLIPAFHRITGLMQFDLFHAYTVDEHTLFVVRNLRRFMHADMQHREAFGLACELAQSLIKPEILLLAGIFHDIAKGRGGDHATLGAEDARLFGLQAALSNDETDDLAWLVDQHLLMSQTAQKQDLSDPIVIQRFCDKVGTPERLAQLYLLTVADICATSPVVWNGWKDNLLRDCYRRSLRHMQHQKNETLADTQLALTSFTEHQKAHIETIWNTLDTASYRLHQSTDDLIRHAHLLLQDPLPALNMQPSGVKGVCTLTLFTHDHLDSWLTITAACDRARLNILDARLYTTTQAQLLIDLKFLHPINWSEDDQQQWLSQLKQQLTPNAHASIPCFYAPSQRQKHFTIDTQIKLNNQHSQHSTTLTLVTRDQPGLLFQCAQVFHSHQLKLVSARISTAGIRAEDTFHLTNQDNQPIDPRYFTAIENDLMHTLMKR
jgi:[protein-PII] uridylyltransferase